ncbi:MAG: CoA-binding protein [Candidatus Caldarchaeales archaeon]
MSIPSDGLSDEEIIKILEEFKVVAVVGMSKDPLKPGHYVPKFLMKQGYKIIPVNPTVDEILGLKSYPSLLDIPEEIEIVNVFRRPEYTVEIAEEAVKKKAKVLWLQEGIYNPQTVEIAKRGGLTVVWDRCMMKEHNRLMKSKPHISLRKL